MNFLMEGDPLAQAFEHAMDHALVGQGKWWGITKLAVMMWISAAVLIACAAGANKKSLVPKGILRFLFEKTFFFIRDELVYPTMGEHHGRHFMPFFLTVFTFIYTLNLMGMVPIPVVGGATASTLGFTIPMALIVFTVSTLSGIAVNGFGGFIHGFMPPGVPKALLPILFVIEIVGYVIKHRVLAIRLFANMLAGHLVIGALLALIFMFKSYGIAPVSVGLALFVSFLELLVAFLQAYVFTLLSVLFVGGTVHPDH